MFIFFLICSLLACKQEKSRIIEIETSIGEIRLKLYDESLLHRDNFVKLVGEGYYNGLLFHRVIKDFMIQAGDPDSRQALPDMLLGTNEIGYTLPAEIMPQFFHKRGALAAARESDNVNPEKRSSGSHFYIVKGRVFQPEELDKEVEIINNRRYTALFNRLKEKRLAEIMKYQAADDYESLMRINRELSDATRVDFDKVKLVLSDEQRRAYTTIGGAPHLDGEYTVFGEVVGGMDVVVKIEGMSTDGNFRPLEDVRIRKIEIIK